MAVTATYSQDDARGAAWLLASTAQRCLANPEIGSDWQDALNNAHRLLEARRSSFFFGQSSRSADYSIGGPDGLCIISEAEQNLPLVVSALDSALRDVFADISKDHAITLISNSLRAVAYPGKFDADITLEARQNAAKFFELFANNLDFA